MQVFETKRLILREFTLEDASSLFNIYQGEDVLKYIGTTSESIETEQENISKMQELYLKQGFGLWATILKDTNRLIGRCGLIQWDIQGEAEVEVAYLIERELWGNGYATEAAQGIVKYAVRTLGLKRLIALINRRNRASIKVASNLTMNFESTQRLKGRLISMYSLDLNYTGIPEYFNYIY